MNLFDLTEAKKGLYYNVNRRKKAGISRSKNAPKAPSAEDWKNAAKTAKEDVNEGIEIVYEKIDEDYASMGTGGGAGVANGGGGGAAGETSPRNNHSVIGSDGIEIDEHIVKVKGGYELKSKKTGKNLGKYPTRAGAEKRERQVQYFKHAGKSVDVNEAQDAWHSADEWHGEQTDEWHGGASDRWHGQGDAWHSMEEAAPDTATRLKHNLKRGGFDMDRFDAKIREIEARNRELADEFYARHPELDDRPKTVDEDDGMFTSIGSDAGAAMGAATTAPENNLSPIGSGTVDEGRDDEVGFGVSSEQAYRAVMAKFGDSIEHRADGVMYAPRELWGAIEQTAFDADGVGAEEDSGMDEDQNAGGGGEPATDSTSPVGGGGASVEEDSLNEFAPGDSDGGEEETLHKYARMWYNGDYDTQQQVEQVLARMGWEIGEVEDEEGGVFVVQQGDINGDSYLHFPVDDLSEGVAEGQLEFNTPDPVVVIQDKQGKMLDQMNLSVAAQKYRLGQPENIKKQLAHQNYTTIGNYVVVSPMSGQPQDSTTQNVPEAKEEDITEDIYESRLYKMKLAGFFE